MSHKLGDVIRLHRERRGWSQDHLAQVAGIGMRTVQRIEAGRVRPIGDTLQAIASAFNLTVADIQSGLTAKQISSLREDFLCPTCGSQLVERSVVLDQSVDDVLDVFECGYTRGARWRPCRMHPDFPKFEDYDLRYHLEHGEHLTWCCYPVGRTRAAKAISLQIGRGRTQEEAMAWVRYHYIDARDGNEAPRAFIANAFGGAS